MRTQETDRRPDDRWYPVAVEPRYGQARAWIDPNPKKGWIRRMLPVLMARRGLFFSGIAATVIAILIQLGIPIVARRGIDDALLDRTVSITAIVVALVALAAGRAIFNFISRYFLFRSGYGIEYDLRTMLYDHLTRMSFSFYDRVQSGQLISRANSDIRSVQMFLVFAPMMGTTLITFCVAMVIMLQTSVTLTLVALLPLPGVFYVGIRMRRLMFPISWLVQARLAEVATIVDENVAGVRIVKSFGAEVLQIKALAGAARRVQWSSLKQIQVRADYAPLLENLPRLSLMLVLGYGGILVINESISIGSIVLFSQYVLLLVAPFRIVGFLMMMSQRARASAGRIYEILDTPADIVDRPGAYDLDDPRGEIDFRGVGFAYPDGPRVLDGFDFHVSPGETVAIVGRTGCGKSTIARLLLRLYEIDEGEVLVDGHDIRNLTVASLRSQVGMVADDAFLFSDTIHDNIAYGRPDASRADVVAAAKTAGAHEFIVKLPEGYETIVGERGYTLSGGQRQRISIARLLVTNPKILILDDATSSVDVKIEQQIHDALQRVMEGRTTLVIAHRLSTINLADRVVLMEGGRIVAQGSHAELMRTEPRYAEVLARLQEEDLEGAPDGAARPEDVDGDGRTDGIGSRVGADDLDGDDGRDRFGSGNDPFDPPGVN